MVDEHIGHDKEEEMLEHLISTAYHAHVMSKARADNTSNATCNPKNQFFLPDRELSKAAPKLLRARFSL